MPNEGDVLKAPVIQMVAPLVMECWTLTFFFFFYLFFLILYFFSFEFLFLFSNDEKARDIAVT